MKMPKEELISKSFYGIILSVKHKKTGKKTHIKTLLELLKKDVSWVSPSVLNKLFIRYRGAKTWT